MRLLNVGSLVHRVTIQQVTDGVDTSGAPSESWTSLCVAMMGRLYARGSERGTETFMGDQLTAAVITRWTMRYLASMDPDLVDVQKRRRLLYQTRVYDIIAVDPLDRKAGLVLRTLASSKVPS